MPQDREGSFEPVIVPKRKRRLDRIDAVVLSLSAGGLTTGEIAAHFEEVFGARVSKDTISRITEESHSRTGRVVFPASGSGPSSVVR